MRHGTQRCRTIRDAMIGWRRRRRRRKLASRRRRIFTTDVPYALREEDVVGPGVQGVVKHGIFQIFGYILELIWEGGGHKFRRLSNNDVPYLSVPVILTYSLVNTGPLGVPYVNVHCCCWSARKLAAACAAMMISLAAPPMQNGNEHAEALMIAGDGPTAA
jgi:hypothetical protein